MPANAAGVNNTHPNHARSEGRRTTSCTAGSYAEIDVVVSQAKRNATPVCCAARLRMREKCDARSGQWFTYCLAAEPFESGLQWIVRDVPFRRVAGSKLSGRVTYRTVLARRPGVCRELSRSLCYCAARTCAHARFFAALSSKFDALMGSCFSIPPEARPKYVAARHARAAFRVSLISAAVRPRQKMTCTSKRRPFCGHG
jgi:hypothetical protein